MHSQLRCNCYQNKAPDLSSACKKTAPPKIVACTRGKARRGLDAWREKPKKWSKPKTATLLERQPEKGPWRGGAAGQGRGIRLSSQSKWPRWVSEVSDGEQRRMVTWVSEQDGRGWRQLCGPKSEGAPINDLHTPYSTLFSALLALTIALGDSPQSSMNVQHIEMLPARLGRPTTRPSQTLPDAANR